MTTISDTHYTLTDAGGCLWRTATQFEMHTLQNPGESSEDWGDVEAVGTLDSYREANAEDDYTLMMLDLLEAGADEVIMGGGASPRTRIRPVQPKVTDEQIRRLETEAVAAGDIEQAATCRRALGKLIDSAGLLRGDQWGRVMNMTPAVARASCDRAIRMARADTL